MFQIVRHHKEMILSRKIATKYYRYFETDNLDIRTFGGLDNWIMKKWIFGWDIDFW